MDTDLKVEDFNNKCFTCGKMFRKYRVCKKGPSGLTEVDLIIDCITCRNLIKRREKLKQSLIEIDYDIFMRQKSFYE